MPTIISKPIRLILFIPTSPRTRSLPHSRFLQLRVLLHQLLQTEARELYRNLRVFPIPLALIDRPFAVFRVLDLLSRTKSALAGRLFDRQLWELEFLPTRGKELGDVVDRIVAPHRSSSLRLNP